MTSASVALGRDAQHFVGVGQARIRARAEPRTLRRPPARPVTVIARVHAQHGFERREFERGNAERATDALEDGARTVAEAIALDRGLELDLDEQAAQVGLIARERAQAFERRLERKVGQLAGRETLDGAQPIGLGQREAAHGATRSVDLLLGDAAVALGDVAHDLERGLEERAAQFGGAGRAVAGREPARLRLPAASNWWPSTSPTMAPSSPRPMT